MTSQPIGTLVHRFEDSPARRLPPVPPVGAALLIGWLFGFLVVLQATWLLHTSDVSTTRKTMANELSVGVASNTAWVWLLVIMGLLGFVLLQLHWGVAKLQRRALSSGLTHFSLALCGGLLTFGVQLVLLVGMLTDQPILLDYSQQGSGPRGSVSPSADGAATPSGSSLVGDAANGRKVFVMSCVTCHGATGEGLNNLAPSLRSSEFVKSSSQSAIGQVIALGRALNDPANKSGKVMPAKGGNPYLKDQEIADLAAFVASLPDGGESPIAAPSNAPVLAKWVVPAATAPPVGLAESAVTGPTVQPIAALLALEDKVLLKRRMSMLALIGHAVLVGVLFLVMARSLFGWLLGLQSSSLKSWFFLVTWGWWVAAATWLVGLGILGW